MSEQEQQSPLANEQTKHGQTNYDNPKKEFIAKLLNKTMKVKITDGRTLIGTFLCTDRDANIVLGSCLEYVNFDSSDKLNEPRSIGLSMIPHQHIISIHIDDPLIA